MKPALRSSLLAGVAWSTALVAPVVRWVDRAGARRETPGDPQEFLLIRLDLLGDVIFSLTAARMIKSTHPQARVIMLTLPQTAELAALSTDVDAVITVDTNLVRSPRTLLTRRTLGHLLGSLRKLRASRYDVVISLYGRTASLLALAAKSNLRIGYGDEAYPSTLDHQLAGGRLRTRPRLHDVAFGARLVRAATAIPGGISVKGFQAVDVGVLPPPHIESVEDDSAGGLLRENGVRDDDNFIALIAASGYGNFKRWPAEMHRELATRLACQGLKTVLVGGTADSDVASTIAAASPAVSLVGHTSITQLVAVLRRAAVVVGGDSGPLHLAAALGTPVVGIYGPTDPWVNGPDAWAENKAVVLRRDLACSPCYSVRTRAGCPLGHPVCMDLVTVDSVLDSVHMLLDRDDCLRPAPV